MRKSTRLRMEEQRRKSVEGITILELLKKHDFIKNPDGCEHSYIPVAFIKRDDDGRCEQCCHCMAAGIRHLAKAVKQAGLMQYYDQLEKLANAVDADAQTPPVFFTQ